MSNYEYQPPQPSQQPPQGKQYGGLAIAGMVIGIVSLFIWWIPFIGLVLTIVGLILSGFGMKSDNRGMAIAGLVTNILGLIGSLFWVLIVVLGIFADLSRGYY